MFGFAAVNVWQADAEAYNVAKTLTTSVKQIDSGIVESNIVWEVPSFSSGSSVELDRFGVCVVSETFFSQKQMSREEFDCEVVVINESFVSMYGAGVEDFHHNFLKSVFNKSGSYDEVLNFSEVSSLLEFVSSCSNQSVIQPLSLTREDAMMLSSITVFLRINQQFKKKKKPLHPLQLIRPRQKKKR